MPHVIIIGGGAIGASVAYHLASKSVRDVVLLEKESALAMGSTGRSVGGIRHQFSTATNIKLSLGSVAKFKRFNDEIGSADFYWCGYLFLLDNEKDVADFKRNVALQQSFGVPVSLITPQRARELVPQLNVDDIRAATFCAADGFGDPSAVALGYASAARRLGVTIRSAVEVIGIKVEGGRVRGVKTTREEIDAEWVIDAAGPYAGVGALRAGLGAPSQAIEFHHGRIATGRRVAGTVAEFSSAPGDRSPAGRRERSPGGTLDTQRVGIRSGHG